MNIVVTGANGFLGSNIIKKLLLENCNVYAFSKHTNNLNNILHKIQYDSAHTKDIIEIYEKKLHEFNPDVIIHCGWSGGNSRNFSNDINQFYDNVPTGIELIKSISKLEKKPIFIGFGSFEEYGKYNDSISESDLENPTNLYGLSKFVFKNYSKLLCEQNNINWIWVRPCYIYGPYDAKNRLIPTLINKFLNHNQVVLDSCEKYIDYLYIDDFTTYMYEIIIRNKQGVYNICSGNQYKLKDVVYKLKELTNSSSVVEFNKNLDNDFTYNNICGQNNKIINLTGVSTKIDLELGLKLTIDFNKSNL